MQRLGVGCIGLGRMGTILTRLLATRIAEATVVAVADVNRDRAQTVAAQYGVRWVEDDFAALLAIDEVEAVVIATPSATHATLVEAAAMTGRTVFCEKPLALTLEDCDRAITAVERAAVSCQVGFMRRFDSAYTEAKRLIDSGAIGRPVTFKAVSRDPAMPPLHYAREDVSGGLIADMGVHDFDLARWLMGSEVVRVFVEGDTLVFDDLRAVGDLDNAVIGMRFASAALGNVEVSRNALYGYDIRTEVLGSEGAVFIGSLRQTPVLLLTSGGAQHDVFGYIVDRFEPAYENELRAFVRHVLEHVSVSPTGVDARAATEIALAATRSQRSGLPVSLPLAP